VTAVFSDMLYLLSCEINGRQAGKINTDITKILQTAATQGVWMLVANAALGLELDEVVKKQIKMKLQASLAASVSKIYSLYGMVDKLSKSGISCCTLKGISNSVLYPNPDYRTSADVDLLISVDDKEKALDLLSKNGFYYDKEATNHYEVVCRNKKGEAIELHTQLYDDLRCDVLFGGNNGIDEEFIEKQIPNYFKITTLSINNGAIYNFLHCVKHFLGSGVGIRQISDVLLYTHRFWNEMDREKFISELKRMKYDAFFNVCQYIGKEYLGISPLDGFYMENEAIIQTAGKLLEDIESGGVFGRNKEERKEFYFKYMNRVLQKKELKASPTFLGKIKSAFKATFIKKEVLYIKYPYLKKWPILLPYARVKRVFDYLLSKKDRKENYDTRMQLIEDLNMI